MDLSSTNRRERLHWPRAAALTLMLAAAQVWADDDCRRPPPEESPWDAQMDNPCFKNPGTFGKGERIVEHISCRELDRNCGTLRTTSRSCQKGDRVEERTRTDGDGFGVGDTSQVRYDLKLLIEEREQQKRTTVVRHKPNPDTRMTFRHREQGNPKRPTLALGTSTGGCGPDNLQACASPFVVTIKSETRNGVPVKPQTEPDTECRNRDGSKRGENDD